MSEEHVVEVAVRREIGRTYNLYHFDKETIFIKNMVRLLMDNDNREIKSEGRPSNAAFLMHQWLWGSYSGSYTAAIATCDLFHSLGREEELGWVQALVPDYRYVPLE